MEKLPTIHLYLKNVVKPIRIILSPDFTEIIGVQIDWEDC